MSSRRPNSISGTPSASTVYARCAKPSQHKPKERPFGRSFFVNHKNAGRVPAFLYKYKVAILCAPYGAQPSRFRFVRATRSKACSIGRRAFQSRLFLCVFRKLRQLEALVVIERIGDIPRRGEQQQRVPLEVLDDLGVARQLELLD